MLLGRIMNDLVSEVTLTLVAAYSCYLIAEGTELKVSGVLAVVFCGLYLSEWALFGRSTEKTVRAFWHIAEYVADTLVFVVSGLIVAKVVYQGNITSQDWG